MKPHDRNAVPICAWEHRLSPTSQHRSGNEEKWWADLDLDPFAIATKFYAEYGGTGGKPRKPREIKPRKPKEQRAKIRGRSSFR
jgi:hypothetical protein